MRPRLQQLVQRPARTLRGDQLPMAVQSIVDAELLLQHALLEQRLHRMQLALRRRPIDERADERNADGLLVEASRVRALLVPAAANVDGTVAADQEIVADIVPAQRVHVIRLNGAHRVHTFRLYTIINYAR